MTTDIHIKGLEGLQALLDELPARIEKNVVRGGLRAAAKVVEAEAKRLCPVGEGDLPKGRTSGALRDSIHVSMRTRRGRVQATIGAGGGNAWYAGMVEHGTARHWIKPKNRKSLFLAGLERQVVLHPGATKKPFMRPAIDAKAQEAIETFSAYLKNRLARIEARK